jgi:hypothetical protein
VNCILLDPAAPMCARLRRSAHATRASQWFFAEPPPATRTRHCHQSPAFDIGLRQSRAPGTRSPTFTTAVRFRSSVE